MVRALEVFYTFALHVIIVLFSVYNVHYLDKNHGAQCFHREVCALKGKDDKPLLSTVSLVWETRVGWFHRI